MTMERLFATFKGDWPTGSYDPGDPESYEQFIQAMIADSRDYEGSVLAGDRDQAQKYYYGLEPRLGGGNGRSDREIVVQPTQTFEEVLNPEPDGPNKSSFVSTDVRDAVMLMLPSLIRLFDASEKVVALTPRTQADVDAATQQTSYINYVFWQDNPGFLILHGAFKDALTVKTGFVKWWTDDHKETRRKTFVNLTQAQVGMLQSQDQTAKLVHLGDMDPLVGTYDEVTFSYQVDKPLIKVAGVPPEEMRLDRYARSFATSRIVGHERIAPIAELTAMGYDREECLDYIQAQATPEFTTENLLRNAGRNMSTRVGDGVLYGEWYIKADRDGDGVAELRFICTMGEEHKIVHDVEANRIKFAVFGVDPISHTIVGDSIADYVMDLQRIKTNATRAMLDSAADSINPRTVVNELTTNLDDALNDELGAVIRTRGDVNNAVSFNNVPFLGQQMLPVLELLNDTLQRRTGLSDAAKGLDPKALQSSTSIGVEAIINGAQERTELVARVLAETGFKDLFTGLYNEIAEAPNQRRTLRLNGKWSDLDTGTFDASMGVEVNSSLGKGSDQVRMMTLQQIKADQQMIMQQFGVTNPVCGIMEYLNTISDMLDIANIKNVGRYFKTPDPNTLQQIASTPKEPDPMAVAAKAQFEKVRSETAQAIGEQNFRGQKLQSDDAFRQQKLKQDADLAQQKLAIERAKVFVGAGPAGPTAVDPIEAAKIGVDLHKAHLDAAMQGQQMQLDAATDQAKIQQQREAAALQAQTAQANANDPNGGGA
jgi:hypothetical protein